MTTLEEHDRNKDQQAQDMIDKFIADGMTEEGATRKWEYLGRDMPDRWIKEMLKESEK